GDLAIRKPHVEEAVGHRVPPRADAQTALETDAWAHGTALRIQLHGRRDGEGVLVVEHGRGQTAVGRKVPDVQVGASRAQHLRLVEVEISGIRTAGGEEGDRAVVEDTKAVLRPGDDGRRVRDTGP